MGWRKGKEKRQVKGTMLGDAHLILSRSVRACERAVLYSAALLSDSCSLQKEGRDNHSVRGMDTPSPHSGVCG